MKFIGEKRVVTPPALAPVDPRLLDDFFLDGQNRNLLFPANDAQEFAGPLTNEMIDTWSREAALGGGCGPVVDRNLQGAPVLVTSEVQHQEIMQIYANLQMPGLKVVSESIIGAKLLLSGSSGSEKNEYPEYQFTLLDSNLKPSGPAPIVWLFNKIIKYRYSTSSFTKVRVEKIENDSENIAFVTDARLETRIHLPSTRLKLLPAVNVSKYEQQGSQAIQSLLEKELEPALCGFRHAYCAFIQLKETLPLLQQ
jgi:hypothetical protein